ncbi:phytanoyl-CoA dioxygenase family protein [Microcoleus sp. MON1_C5]|uniref:phytanoyl-CoA dioxygenase family protein n=1 Tax=Microcoleus sp. MON1_C5 TaxID=2818828 RepID=UPI002FD12E51
MQLTSDQLKTYEDQGYLLLPNSLAPGEVEVMRTEASALCLQDLAGKILKKDGKTVKMIHGTHLENKVFHRLVRHPKLLKPVMQILGDSAVYIHRCSLNFKPAFEDTMWSWHQDSFYFCKEDGMPTDQAVIAIVFLDEVNEFNGPILLMPGSHKEGLINPITEEEESSAIEEKQYLKSRRTQYMLSRPTVTKLVEKYGIVAPKGSAGSVLLFHPSCVHGSAPNIMSPFNRTIAVIAYNSVENIPIPVENPRPEYVAGRDYRPIEPLSEDVLLQVL